MSDPSVEYYTAKEAAEILDLKYATLLSRTHKGYIEFEKFGYAVMYRKEVIHALASDMESPTR